MRIEERQHPVKLNAAIIEAFAGTFLSPRYDDVAATPQFHREAWKVYASDAPLVAMAAPREHAKTTGCAFVFILAEVLFRASDYVILVGSTEENAGEILSNIIEEVRENDDLREEFGISELERDSQTDLIVRMEDGHRWRVLARGAEQKIRGKMWNGRRPNLLVCDDMEDDEQVMNKDRRTKFRHWFTRAARQAVSRRGRIRVHGTILHEDSLLARFMKSKSWKHLFYKAHESFDDFSNRLWPEAWSEARLRARRQEFIEDGDSGGYSQEFLNDPQDNADAYLRKSDFMPMSSEDHARPKIIGAAADFAVSKNDIANRTSFTVGGKDTLNLLHIIDERVGRWASLEQLPDGTKAGWIEEMFSVQQRWDPQFFWVEAGVIWDSIKHIVQSEMRERDIFINIIEVPSIKDKAARGRTLQKRMKSGSCRFDKEAEWYAGYENELRKFTGGSQATLDDQFDSTSLLAIGFDRYMDAADEEDFVDPEELEIQFAARRRVTQGDGGRSPTTGY